MKKPVVLCIMDGFGYNPSDYGNAIVAANTPRLDEIFKNNPMTYIGASGMDVGLPDGQMGNSEVGHTNIGAGRIVYQELTRITKSIQDGDFFNNEEFLYAIENAKKNGKGMTSFQAFTTAVAAQVGTGNIIGACGAIFIGGPGAIFWMWVSAVAAMLLKYAETVLALRHRCRDRDGTYHGGAMYYMKDYFSNIQKNHLIYYTFYLSHKKRSAQSTPFCSLFFIL